MKSGLFYSVIDYREFELEVVNYEIRPQTDTYCLTNSQNILLLTPCDSSKNQVWTFQERDPVLEVPTEYVYA